MKRINTLRNDVANGKCGELKQAEKMAGLVI